ncbi:hypothetical protein V6N11_040102 [Hibiscus sabdariffa]|uniref:Protein SKIP34 n=1 Tax=Hibiscus sabdariffa TaxID=183260 RepID=A0ABR2RGK3_9ROSI
MCYGQQRRSLSPNRPSRTNNALAVNTLRVRLAETEARLERARAREAELTRRLEEMKRFVSVMEILESYLKQKFLEQQDCLGELKKLVFCLIYSLHLLIYIDLRSLTLGCIEGIRVAWQRSPYNCKGATYLSGRNQARDTILLMHDMFCGWK